MSQSKNVPNKLRPLIERWNNKGKGYYLCPENMFTYRQHKIMYHGGQDLPMSGWFASNGMVRDYTLSKEDIEEIQSELLQYYRPTRWTLTLDYHCNYQCPMCAYHGNGVAEKEDYYEERNIQKRVVPKEEAYRRIDCLVEYGIKTLNLTSAGEIILYPYWKDVSNYAHEKGIKLWMITNGSLWTEDMVKVAAELGYTDIRVSLDALSYEVYSKIRSSRRDYYERAMALPELLTKYGITTNVHFVKQKENLHEAEAFLDYWKKKKVNSISIANEYVYDGDVVINKFENSKKEYIEGLCTAFGNMQTLQAGDTKYCCGMIPELNNEVERLDEIGCHKVVDDAIEAMCTKDSELRKLCHKCALYVPYSDEEIIGNWRVVKTYERETWNKLD